jgi:hypothetical protein
MAMLLSHDTFNFDTNHVRRGKSGSDYAKYLFLGVFCAGALWCLLGKQANDLLWTFLTDDWG